MLNFRGFEVGAGWVCFKQHMIYDSKFPGKDHVYIYIDILTIYASFARRYTGRGSGCFPFFKATQFLESQTKLSVFYESEARESLKTKLTAVLSMLCLTLIKANTLYFPTEKRL